MQRYDLDPDELETYAPDIPEPADLDGFWSRTLAEHPFDPAAMRCVPVDTPLTTVDVHDLTFPGFAVDPIHAWVTRPAGASGPLPAVVEYIGYGGGRGLPGDHLQWASAGFVHLLMDTRGQGASWGDGGATADPHGTGTSTPGFMTRGIESPETYYYRRVYVDAHHAVEAAAALPWVDPARIAVQGISQGGGLTIAAAALNHRVVAARATAPALFSTALMDATCPPSTVFAARNRWGGEAQIVVHPFNDHEGGQGHQWLRQVGWLRERLEDADTAADHA